MSEEEIKICKTTCVVCGIIFGFPLYIEKLWRENHQNFHCPNGHILSWEAETSEEKELKSLRKEVKDLKNKLSAALEEVDKQTKISKDLAIELEIWQPSEQNKAS